MYYLIEIMANIFDLSILYYFMSLLFDKKSRFRFWTAVIIILLQAFIMRYTNDLFGNLSITLLILNILLTLAGCMYLFRIIIWKYLISILVFTISLLISEAPVTLFFNYILKISKALLLSEVSIYRAFSIIISKMIFLLITVNIRTLLVKMEKQKNKIYSVIISMMILINIILHFVVLNIYIMNAENHIIQDYLSMLVLVCIAIINVLSVFIVLEIIKYINKEVSWHYIKREYENQIDYYKNYDEFIHEIRNIRHDFINHMVQVQNYLTDNNLRMAQGYLNKILMCSKDVNLILVIENKIVGSLINYKKIITDKNNIRFDFYVNIPQLLPVEDVDMTIILGNILDNAIEACIKCSSIERFIELKMKYADGVLSIELINSSEYEPVYDKSSIITSKTDKKNHGIGMENVKRATDKYEGKINVNYENSLFITKIFLNA